MSRRWEAVIFSEGGEFKDRVIRALLTALSWAYGAATLARNRAYDRGLLKARRVPVPVVSIGNLSLGGTGKTAVTLWVARELARAGKKVAVLSRGYGRKSRGTVVVSDGKNILADADASGDEPLLLAQELTGTVVVVDADRFKAAQLALERFKPDCLVLDDGFQHRRLARDLDVVCLNEAVLRAPWLFPRGVLRETVTSMRRAKVAVVKLDAGQERLLPRFERLFSHPNPLPHAAFTYAVKDLKSRDGAATVPTEWLKGRKVAAVSGIARPEGFSALLQSLGAEVAWAAPFEDHHAYGASELSALKARAESDGCEIVTTEKDAVKLPKDFPAMIVRVELRWLKGEGILRNIILKAVER